MPQRKVHKPKAKTRPLSRRIMKRLGEFVVYILQCNDGTFYTGHTNNFERRFKEHAEGKKGARYLKGKGPLKLVFRKDYSYFKSAFAEERRIKTLSRQQKENLVKTYR